MSRRKSWNFLNDICNACAAAGVIVQPRHWYEHCDEREPSHSSSVLHEVLCALHVMRFTTDVLSPSRKFGGHSSQVAEHTERPSREEPPHGWLDAYTSSVIVDEGCQLKVAKMLFPMKDTDLHCNPVWTELRDFYLEQWVCYFGTPQRVRVDSEGPWMPHAAAMFFGKGKCLAGTDSWTSTLADRTRGGGNSRSQGDNDRHCTESSRHGST